MEKLLSADELLNVPYIRIFRPLNSGYNCIRLDDGGTVQNCIELITKKLDIDPALSIHFGVVETLREAHFVRRRKWLRPTDSLKQLVISRDPYKTYDYHFNVRFFPTVDRLVNYQDNFLTILYDQLWERYRRSWPDCFDGKRLTGYDADLVLRLGCLEIKRLFNDMTEKRLEKRGSFQYLERSILSSGGGAGLILNGDCPVSSCGGLRRFFPPAFLDQFKQRKRLKKTIRQGIGLVETLTPTGCRMETMRLMFGIHRLESINIEVLETLLEKKKHP